MRKMKTTTQKPKTTMHNFIKKNITYLKLKTFKIQDYFKYC